MKSRRVVCTVLPLVLLLAGVLLVFKRSDEPTTEVTAAAPNPHGGESARRAMPADPDVFRAFDAWAANPGADVGMGIDLAKARRAALKSLIVRDPQRAFARATSIDQRAMVPAEVRAHLEVPVSSGAGYEVIVTCFSGGLDREEFEAVPARAEMQRFVTAKGNRYEAFTWGRRLDVTTKDWMSVRGIAIDDVMALHPEPVLIESDGNSVSVEMFGRIEHFAGEDEAHAVLASLTAEEDTLGPGIGVMHSEHGGEEAPPLPEEAESAWTEGAKRILYLRARFADEDPAYEPVTLAQAQAAQADVEQHMEIASYGKMTIATTFTDVLTLSMNKSEYNGQALGTMINEARALAITEGNAQGEDWDYNNHDFYTIITNTGIGGYAGVAQVGGKKSHLYRNYISLRTAGHEFGHNFGLSHAYYNYTSQLNPRGTVPVDGLGRVEYGHRFSVMSAQSGSDLNNPAIPHFTVHEKWRLDWLTDTDMVDISSGSQSGIYRLFQNDLQNASGLRALRVPSGGNLSKYWISYRTAWNNEYLDNGVLLNWTGSGGGTSTLLDMTPYSDDGSTSGSAWTRDNRDKWDASLTVGRTYTDEASGVSVTPVARGGSAPDAYLDVYVHVASGVEERWVSENDACRAVIPNANTANGTEWTAIGFDDSSWPHSGNLGVGYDEESAYRSFIGTDVEATMNNRHTSAYIRVPFTIPAGTDLNGIEQLKLLLRYDDGFAAYINGVKIADGNSSTNPTWNSGASGSHSDSSAVEFEEFSANAALGALVPGTNILAIHGMNNGQSSSDFLIQPQLVAVYAGAPNADPTVTLAASAVSVGTGENVMFNAAGSDSDGDPLAYAWHYDEGDDFSSSGLNAPTATKSWGSAGLYLVEVVCSDRKGGVARDRVLVRVGTPSSDRIIRGFVRKGGEPVAGARVYTDTKQTTSADDGSYLLVGLAPGAHSVSAMKDGEVFQPSVAMPVTPSPVVYDVDFWAHEVGVTMAAAQVLSVTPGYSETSLGSPVSFKAHLWDNSASEDLLVPFGDTWKYLDDGSSPPASWSDPGFDDSAWSAGAAELGYGDSDEATVVSFGSDSSDKHITTYFRRTFPVTNLADVSRLKLTVKRDDGVRVFLNGTEIVRDNLTTGTVSSTTEARNDVSSSVENTLLAYSVPVGLLVEGDNTLAVDVHQEADDSSDLSFDLELSAARNLVEVAPSWSVTPGGSAISPAGVFDAAASGPFTVTATFDGLNATADIDVSSDNIVTITMVDSAFIGEASGESRSLRVRRTGSTASALPVAVSVGGTATSGSDFAAISPTLMIPQNAATADILVTPNNDDASEGIESVSVSIQPNAAYSVGTAGSAAVRLIDDDTNTAPVARIDDPAGGSAQAIAGVPLALQGGVDDDTQFVVSGAYWRLLDDGSDPGIGWAGEAFDDSAWGEGLAQFGYGDGDETTVVEFGGDPDNKHITSYFRTGFSVDDPSEFGSLSLDLLRDDGAVIYLNGIEVVRDNLPNGTITASTLASSSIGGSDEDTFNAFTIPATGLVPGLNVLAGEIHQRTDDSSDISFDLVLAGTPLAPDAAKTYLWELVSGPGNALFSAPDGLDGSVAFDQPGSYVVRLTVDDGEFSDSEDLSITVDDPRSYATWIAGFSQLAGPDADPSANPDGDDSTNFLEYATVGDPTDESTDSAPVLSRDGGGVALLFTYRRLKADNPGDASGSTGIDYTLYGVRYSLEASTDTTTWSDAAITMTLEAVGSPADNGDGSETVTVRLIPPVENDLRWFARLKVEGV